MRIIPELQDTVMILGLSDFYGNKTTMIVPMEMVNHNESF